VEKRYQVFISSTSDDLKEERKEIMQVLLEQNAIPAGMELFPAADEDQWSLIKKVIDASDYYLVVVAGRYGSIGPDGISYTEMEFRYAKDAGKPIIGFIHEEPGKIQADKSEQTVERREMLEDFRKLVKTKPVRFYTNPEGLGSAVSRSLTALITSRPAIGWVRGDQVPEEGATKEILTLRRRIDELQQELEATRVTAPSAAAAFASGDSTVELQYSFFGSPTNSTLDGTDFESYSDHSWNEIFANVAPLMIDEASDFEFKSALNSMLMVATEAEAERTNNRLKGTYLSRFKIKEHDFNTVKIQLRALGLITKSTRSRSVKDQGTYWTLTPYGDNLMTQLRAIRKPSAE